MTRRGRLLVRYSIVIPVLNEQDNILPLVEELYTVLTGAEHEVVFVDDGSTDATPQRLADAMARFPRLRLVRHSAKSGKSAALVTGARAARGGWIVTMDGDGQNDPRDIPRLLEAAWARPEIVLAAGNRRKRDDTVAKRITSRLGNGIRRALLRDACPDTACGLKAIRRDVLLALPFFDSMHRFFPALVQGRGLHYVNVAINDRARHAGTSKYTNLGRAAVGLFDLFGVMWLLRRTTLPPTVTETAHPSPADPGAGDLTR